MLPADPSAIATAAPGAAHQPGGTVPLRAASLLELRGYLHDTLLRDGDAVTMHHGLELRVPFLDPELAALALALDEPQHRQGGCKGLLRQVAAPLLPAAVLCLLLLLLLPPLAHQWLLLLLLSKMAEQEQCNALV